MISTPRAFLSIPAVATRSAKRRLFSTRRAVSSSYDMGAIVLAFELVTLVGRNRAMVGRRGRGILTWLGGKVHTFFWFGGFSWLLTHPFALHCTEIPQRSGLVLSRSGLVPTWARVQRARVRGPGRQWWCLVRRLRLLRRARATAPSPTTYDHGPDHSQREADQRRPNRLHGAQRSASTARSVCSRSKRGTYPSVVLANVSSHIHT